MHNLDCAPGSQIPHIWEDIGSGGDEVSAELIVLDSRVGDSEGQHVLPPQGLPDEGVDVHEHISVLEIREAIRSNDGIELGLGPLLNGRIQGHGDEHGLHG